MAGGRGALSFALHALHGVPCTVVDPRSALPSELCCATCSPLQIAMIGCVLCRAALPFQSLQT